MFPLSTSSVLEDMLSAAVFGLQDSVPLQFVQAMTQNIPGFLQERWLLPQGSFAVTLHWQHMTFCKILAVFELVGRAYLCAPTPTLVDPDIMIESRLWQICRWTRNAWK